VSSKPVFESIEEHERTVAAVKRSPRRQGEGTIEFLDRIAREAALMPQQQLPIREPGEDDE